MMNGYETTSIDVGYGDAWNAAVRKPTPSIADWFGVIDRAAGDTEKVSSLNAINNSATWAPVMVIASDVAQIPFPVMRRSGDADELAEKHEVHRLLNVRPNAWQTPTAFKEWVVATTIIWGNALVEIKRDSRGRVTALEPIYPYGLDYDIDESGQPFYWQWQPDGELKTWGQSEVLHFRQFGSNGFWGLRLVEIIANEIGLNKEVVAHANSMFNNGMRPGMVLEHPGKMQPEARSELRKSLNDIHAGSRNAGKPMLLWEGMKASSIALSNVDAQLIEMIEAAPVLIARTLRVPPHKIGDYRHSSVRANLEDSQKEYFASTLARPVRDMREEMDYKLFGAGGGLFVKPDPSELLKGDLKTQMETAQVAMASTVWTRNEARAYVGYNPVDGGDEFVNPNTTSNESQEAGNGDSDTDEVAESARKLIHEQAEWVCTLERNRLSVKAGTKCNFTNFLNAYYRDEFLSQAKQTLGPALSMASKLVPVAETDKALAGYAAVAKGQAESYANKSDDRKELSSLFDKHWPTKANAKRLAMELLGGTDEDT